MIIAFDANIHGQGHYFFNKAMLKALAIAFPEELRLYINREQASAHEGRIPQLTIQKIKVQGGGGIKNYWNAIHELFFVLAIIRKAERQKARFVVALSLGPIAHYIVKRKGQVKQYRVPILVCIHGELQALASGGPKVSSAGRLIKAAACLSVPGIFGIVLGGSIRDGLNALGYPIDRIFAIPHPYECADTIPRTLQANRLRFAAPGGAALIKGSHQLFSVAKAVYGAIGKTKAAFSFCGSWDSSLDRYDNGLALHGVAKTQLSVEEYDRCLAESDFFVYLYPKGSYELMASGALFDALRIGRPILALRTGYFEWAFKEAGEFGKLFDTLEELSEFIIAFARKPDTESYNAWLQGLSSARVLVSPRSIASMLVKGFSGLGIR